jgi:biotin carboxyl carrier protein
MEEMLSHGEGLGVPERMIVAPSVGVFRPMDDVDEGSLLDAGQAVGHLEGPGTSTPVCSPFQGWLVGILAHPGERLREGQPVAWLRVT